MNSESIDTSPLIDVAMILIVFVVVAFSFVKEKGVEIEPGFLHGGEKGEIKTFVVFVEENGLFRLNGKIHTKYKLLENLERMKYQHQEHLEHEVLLQVSEDMKVYQYIKLVELIKQSGISRVSGLPNQ